MELKKARAGLNAGLLLRPGSAQAAEPRGQLVFPGARVADLISAMGRQRVNRDAAC